MVSVYLLNTTNIVIRNRATIYRCTKQNPAVFPSRKHKNGSLVFLPKTHHKIWSEQVTELGVMSGYAAVHACGNDNACNGLF